MEIVALIVGGILLLLLLARAIGGGFRNALCAKDTI